MAHLHPPPPHGERTNLPADESVWAAARRGYVEEGLSCPQAAERFGLHPRKVQRTAAAENWTAMRAAHEAAALRRRREALRLAASDDPSTGFVQELQAERLSALLIDPSAAGLAREAAQRCAEAMAADAPERAGRWLALARSVLREADALDRVLCPGDPAEAFRTLYYRGVAERVQAELDGEGAPAGAAEGVRRPDVSQVSPLSPPPSDTTPAPGAEDGGGC